LQPTLAAVATDQFGADIRDAAKLRKLLVRQRWIVGIAQGPGMDDRIFFGVVRSISSRAIRRASSQLRGPIDVLSLRFSLIEPIPQLFCACN
jgi:hypothetical protein